MVIIMLKPDPADKLLAGNPVTIFTSYRSQSIYFLCKSTDWFLYDGNIDC